MLCSCHMSFLIWKYQVCVALWVLVCNWLDCCKIKIKVLKFLIKKCNHRGKPKLAERKYDLCMHEDAMWFDVLFTYSGRRSQADEAVAEKKKGWNYAFIRNGEETKAACRGNKRNSKEGMATWPLLLSILFILCFFVSLFHVTYAACVLLYDYSIFEVFLLFKPSDESF